MVNQHSSKDDRRALIASRSSRPGRRTLASFAVAFAGLTSVLAGCAAIAGLGEEARLRTEQADAAAGNDVVVPPADDATADTSKPKVNVCGLDPSPNETCARRSQEKCCNEGIACSKSGACVNLFACIFDCAGDRACTQKCINDVGADQASSDLIICSAPITECLPSTPECTGLGACCRAIPGSNRAAKDFCNNVVLKDDPTNCLNNTSQFGIFCPADAGSDVATEAQSFSDASQDVSAQ